ncbi:Gp138 family membrane-puncturing spike protein [Shouchella clausii]|uniref:Gp138 family membrane-puncturing spike protein n=1 Tax=Shouchella clausii TaxID=79880 RepID=UPI000BA66C15|nr:Gp138 family membrane-puncturing spike protein [Shouchella clausii]PAE96783.1 hypothetical protein CHH71_12295 [Shouchella clausii]
MNGQDAKFFERFASTICLGIHTTAPARVLSYDADKGTADIKLLFKRKGTDGKTKEYSPILSAPVMKHCDPDIKTGSLVFVSFAERALDNLVNNQTFDPDSNRMHSINDAVVMGVWK